MSLFPNLRVGLIAGLLVGINAVPGPELLADFDYRTPVTAFDFSSEFATDQWDMQDAVTMANSGTVGTETLANSGGLMQQQAIGLRTATSYTARKAWESTATTDDLTASGTTAGDSDNEDFCWRLVYRYRGAQVGSEHVLSKRDSAALFKGWGVHVTSSSIIKFTVDGGAAEVVLDTGASVIDDGGYHWVTGWYDESADLMFVKTDTAAETSADSSTVTDSLANAAPLNFNGLAGLGGSAGIQIIAGGVCVGTNSEAMYDAAEADCVLPGTDPSGLLDPPDRNSLISIAVAAAAVAHFSDDTLPIGYDAALEAASGGLGLYCNNAHTNLVPHSELSTGAIDTDVTSTDNAADAPDGFRSATTLLATAANGNQARTAVTVASTEYIGTAHIEEVTAGVTGRAIMYDESNSAELGATAFTGTGTPQAVEIVASTIAGGISTSVRVEVDTDTETVIAWSWQLQTGDGRGTVIRTSGAAASIVQSDYRATGNHVNEDTGELEAVFVLKVLPPTGELHYVYDTNAAADRRALYVDDTGALKFIVNNSAGGAVATITLGTVVIDTEYTARCQWDKDAGLDTDSVRGKLNALAKVSSGAAFTAGGGFTAEISLGANATTADTALDGFLARLQSFNGPLEMAA